MEIGFWLTYLAVGIFVGFFAGLLGIGGGIGAADQGAFRRERANAARHGGGRECVRPD